MVVLSDQNDEIKWKWTSDGKYTVALAYKSQFIGATTPLPAAYIWTTRTEPKCRFFAWLVMHNKALTADNMAKRNWPCEGNCALCYCIPKTTPHILTRCNFTEALWNKVALFYQLPGFQALAASDGPTQWVRTIAGKENKKEKRRRLGILFSF